MISHNKIISSTLFITICFTLTGCHDIERERQENWWKNQLNMQGIVKRCDGEKADLIGKVQLVAVLGRPDFQGTPVDLLERLPDDKSYRKRIMDEIWYYYLRAKNRLEKSNISPEEKNSWDKNSDFKKCLLLLYDESRHFIKPIPSCVKLGFTCKFYIVEDGKVLTTSSIKSWKPLKEN